MITQPAHKNRIVALTITVLGLITACSSSPVAQTTLPAASSRPPVATPSFGEAAASVALQQIGVPYRYGGTTTSGFDCSGLVQYSYLRAGKRLPRTTSGLWLHTAPISRDQLRVGDLLFFRIEGKMSHVGLYVGSRRFVHAPSSGRTVTVASLDAPFYADALIRAGRPR
jgi:cell wall-associated NlpC family hydrolase